MRVPHFYPSASSAPRIPVLILRPREIQQALWSQKLRQKTEIAHRNAVRSTRGKRSRQQFNAMT